MSRGPCPTQQQLVAFQSGEMTETAAGQLIEHLTECPSCQATLADLDKGDTLNRKLRQPAQPDPYAAEAHARELQARSKAMVGQGRAGGAPAAAATTNPGPRAPVQFGEYQVQEKLGQGGMGAVYKALHRSLRRQVAIKVLAKGRATSPEAIARFHREMAVVGQLIHPNIVTAYDAGQQGGVHYLVMEYVEGHDLARIIKQRGPLPVRLALQCIHQAALGLAHAHEKGIIHRDIKPGNLLLDHKGVVKILDLGLARLGGPLGLGEDLEGERLTQDGQVMGTCDSMAPEQALDTHLADARSDIYSLGCTFYRLLVGRAPYKGDTLMQVLLAHREAPVPSLCAARPDVSPQVDAVFQKMVAKRPEDRYQSMGELVADVETLLGLRGPARAPADTSDSALAENLAFLLEEKPHPSKRVETAAALSRAAEKGRAVLSPLSRAAGEGPGVRGFGHWPPHKKWIAVSAAAAAAAIVLFGILITLRDRHGKLLAKVEAPSGSQITISPEGNIDVALAKSEIGRGKAEGKISEFRTPTSAPADARPASGREAFFMEVAALPPDEQVARVVEKLKELNPGYEGDHEYKIHGGVSELHVFGRTVADLSPVRALTRLEAFRCTAFRPDSQQGRGSLRDLSPLQGLPLKRLLCLHQAIVDLAPLAGMPLEVLKCSANFELADLSPLAGMPLEVLECNSTRVADLSPLRGMPLVSLSCYGTQVSDLSPLKGMQLTWLMLQGTPVKDLRPLEGMPLRTLVFDPLLTGDPHNRQVLRSITTLQKINDLPPAEFWKQVDAGKEPAPKASD